jgi:flagellar biosynthesis protein FliQ
MSEDMVVTLGAETLKVLFLVGGPFLLAAMVIGLFVSVLQAVTQVNESTLTFIPKLVGLTVVLIFMAPWMLDVLKQYTVELLGNVHEWIR